MQVLFIVLWFSVCISGILTQSMMQWSLFYSQNIARVFGFPCLLIYCVSKYLGLCSLLIFLVMVKKASQVVCSEKGQMCSEFFIVFFIEVYWDF